MYVMGLVNTETCNIYLDIRYAMCNPTRVYIVVMCDISMLRSQSRMLENAQRQIAIS